MAHYNAVSQLARRAGLSEPIRNSDEAPRHVNEDHDVSVVVQAESIQWEGTSFEWDEVAVFVRIMSNQIQQIDQNIHRYEAEEQWLSFFSGVEWICKCPAKINENETVQGEVEV